MDGPAAVGVGAAVDSAVAVEVDSVVVVAVVSDEVVAAVVVSDTADVVVSLVVGSLAAAVVVSFVSDAVFVDSADDPVVCPLDGAVDSRTVSV